VAVNWALRQLPLGVLSSDEDDDNISRRKLSVLPMMIADHSAATCPLWPVRRWMQR
jgi:hypothetical protein